MTAQAANIATQRCAAGAPLLQVASLVKRFPGVVAVDDVSLDLQPGVVLALLGQNGAGKSTLIQVLSGIHVHGTYQGRVAVGGVDLAAQSVSDAEAAGIAFLAQEVDVAPNLTVAETLWLNAEPTRFGLLDRNRMRAEARRALAEFDLAVDPDAEMGSLDLATQQLVLIVRALSKDARLLILDEPTAALNEREASRLFDRVARLSRRGVSVIFVSHRLAEVLAVSDRIVIMRDGRIVGDFPTSGASREMIVERMVGRRIVPDRVGQGAGPGPVALELRGFSVLAPGDAAICLVRDAALQVHRGEIVGLFGLLGSGVVELCMALFGAWDGGAEGTVLLHGEPVDIRDPTAAVRLGMGLISQDRRDGLTGEHSIHDNAVLAALDALSDRRGFVDRMRSRRTVGDIARRLNVKAAGIDVPVGALSGGNQQKVQIARWLAAGVDVLLLIDPTRGVDVGARAEITRIWQELAAAGAAIPIVSSEADELIEVCDRVAILSGGRISAEVARADLTERTLLTLAAET